MTEKKKPTYDLTAFRLTFSTTASLNVTGTAIQNAATLGYGRQEIVAVIQTMLPAYFYKLMTSHADHRVWQDVYHVPSEIGTLYIKFTADVLTSFLLLFFKEKENG